MISLFIDTSYINVSISVIKDNKIMSLIQKEIPNLHSVYTTKFVKDALEMAGIDANDVDNIMVVNGPGSFTGLRIGVTIAKTYGYLIKKDLTLLSSLKSLAISSNYKGTIMSVIPGNRSSYYVGVYDETYNDLEKERCVNKEELVMLCNNYEPYIVGVDTSVIGIHKINKQIVMPDKVVAYYIDKEKVSYHKAVPNYLKLPQAIEAKQ